MKSKTPKKKEDKPSDAWVSSAEAKQALGIKDCELMHKRLNGELSYIKRGNAYFYKIQRD